MIVKTLAMFFEKLLHRPKLLLGILFLCGFLLRLALFKVRWINPDEGAHLMDARLWLDGLIPIADFGSRQPFYVFMLLVFIKLFGVSLSAARLMPLLASMGSAFFLYLLGKKMWNRSVGMIAASSCSCV